MQIQVVTITPEAASDYLASNTHNRTIKRSVVQKYAAAMRRGEWALNGETIKLNGDGTLIDGQHRLAAIVEAGVPITTAVAVGIDMSAQDTVDTGARRTLSDALRLRGEPNHTQLSGAIAYLYRHVNGLEGYAQSAYPTIRQGLALLEEHSGLRESIPIGRKLQERIRYNPSMGTWIHYHFSTVDADDAEDFCSRLMTGANLPEFHPILTLRQAIERDAASEQRMDRRRMHAMTIKAWNAYRDGRELRILKWSPGGSRPERFPSAH